jgi:hypothetical protein
MTAICGILGTVALMIYFSAPFWLLPLPAPTASAEEVFTFGKNYHNTILWDTWLQQIGSLLSVIFALALVHLAGVSNEFAGRLILLVSGVILTLSLAEGTFVLGAMQAGENGHPASALTCLDLASVFVHIFLLAPSLFLVLGAAIWRTDILPKIFSRLAIMLGCLFQILGIAGLFSKTAITVVIIVLLLQNLWTLAASCTLIIRSAKKTNA